MLMSQLGTTLPKQYESDNILETELSVREINWKILHRNVPEEIRLVKN